MAALDTLFFDLKINDLTDEQLTSIKKKLSNLGVELDVSGIKNQLESLLGKNTKIKIVADTKDAEESISRLQKISINNSGQSDAVNIIKDNINKLKQSVSEYQKLIDRVHVSEAGLNKYPELGQYLNDKQSKVDSAKKSILAYEETLKKMSNSGAAIEIRNPEPNDFESKKHIADLEQRKRAWNQWAQEIAKTNKENDDASSKLRKESNEVEKLLNVIHQLENATKRFQMASSALGNPENVEQAIQKLKEYTMLARQATLTPAGTSDFMKSSSLGRTSVLKENVSTEISLAKQQEKANAVAAANEKLANSHREAVNAANSHINANMRLGSSMTGLVSISGDLRNQLGMFVSAYTFENLVKNVIEIGGEFEKQKMAMTAMLGSLEQADDIFNRMKNLALTSPFNFKDLSNYSRQLTAYGTDYKDLFDTTNRLADISAGLGGDMSRLVLAFSQVKSASFLRGQEMRQFTEFGVSLPEMLAKKYTEAEGKIVTAGDVIERVSKRMVSFNDVKDVLWKSTDKGGKFFGMQDVLAQSTSGMASNLKDAIDTAYYDIANSNSGVIKDTIKDVTSMVSHWKEFGAVLTSGLGIYSAYRLAMAANNMLIGRGTSETLKSVMASKQEEASILRRKALYGELSAEEKALVANSNTLNVSDIRNLALSKEINADALMRMVNSKKLTAAQALQMGTLLDLSVGQRKYLIDLQNVEIELTRATGFWDRYALSVQKATMTTTSKLSSIGSSISSFMSGILTKANIAMAAIFVGMDAYIEYSQKIKQLDDSNTQTIRNAEDSSKNLNEFLSKNPIKPVLEKGNTDEISKMIDAYKEQITSTPFDMSSFITNVDTITDTTQKLEALRSEMESMKGAEESVAKNGNGFLQAEKSNTTWLPNWVMSMDQGITNVLSRLGVIPQSFRNWEKSGDEMRKSLTNVFSDLQSSTSDLEEEMSKLTNSDIQTGIDKLKDKFPELARQINVMRDAGASNNEVIKSMLDIASDKKIELFPQINQNTYDDYISDYNAMMGKIDQVVNDGILRINSSMDKVDVQGHTEKYKIAVLKSVNEMIKAEGLTGDAAEAAMFKAETAISGLSFKLQEHPKAWKDMYDGIKSILASKGVDITKASAEQVQKAFEAYKTEAEKTKKHLATWLYEMNIYTSKHPIYLHAQLSRIGADPSLTMTGPGKTLNQVPKIKKYFTKDELAEITDDDKQVEAFQTKDKQMIDNYVNAAKTRSKNAGELKKQWNQFRKDTSAYFDWTWDDTHDKKGNPKKPKKPKVEADDYLSIIKDRQSSLKMVETLSNKYMSSDYGEAASYNAVRGSGMSYANILPKDIKTRVQYNEWLYNELTKLINKLSSNRAKLTAKQREERKKELDDLKMQRAEVGTGIQKESFEKEVNDFKSYIDDMTKQWDNYNKLVESGMNRVDASKFVFGVDKSSLSKTEDLVNSFYKTYRGKPVDFTMKESDVAKIMGGENSPTYKEYFNTWKTIKDLIENTRIQIQLDSSKATEQVQDIATKIKKVIDNALNESIGIGSNSGAQPRLSQYANLNTKTGLLEMNAETSKSLSADEISGIKDRIKAVNDEISNLGASLLELLPAWNDIFGDETNKSLSSLKRGMKEATDIVANSTIVTDKGKPSYFMSTFIDEKGNEQSVTGTIQQLERLKKAANDFPNKISDKNPFIGIISAFNVLKKDLLDESFWKKVSEKAKLEGGSTTVTRNGKTETITAEEAKKRQKEAGDKSKDDTTTLSQDLMKGIDKSQKYLQAGTMLGSTVEALGGGSGISDAMGVGGGILSGASSLSALGPYGMAAGAAMGAITSIAQLHDKKLDAAIEKSKRKVQELQLAYKTIQDAMKYALGNQATSSNVETPELKSLRDARKTIDQLRNKGKLSIFDLIKLQSAQKIINNTSDALKNYEKTGNAYQYQLDLYKQQLTEVEKQRSDEQAKKKSDPSKVNDYNSQIEELQTKITQFWQDLASQIYGIDLKGWASQFGDALYDAWQKGSDGATAFKDTTQKVISDVVKKMLDLNMIEPILKDMQTYLFGKNGVLTDGNMSVSDLSGMMGFLSKVKDSTDAEYDYLDKIDEEYKKKYGESLKTNTTSSSANSISGVSEQEANIIAAYMDALRQDSLINRLNLQKIIDSGVTIESPLLTSQLEQLKAIAANTSLNAKMAENLYKLFNDNINGINKLHIS